MITESQIQEAVRCVIECAHPLAVILFGSYARGDAREHSDLDFIVVEAEVKDRHAEMVRLTDALRPLHLPIDVLVVSEELFDYWADTPNTVYYEAKREGQVRYDGCCKVRMDVE